MVFLQVVLFQKPRRYCCNKALSAAHGNYLASVAGCPVAYQAGVPRT